MTPQPAPASVFSLLRFTLIRGEGGLLTQHREHLGDFTDAEAAFTLARYHAASALRHLGQGVGSACAAPPAELEICDTEWGYDVRRDGLAVERFWVHDTHPRQPT